MRYLPLILCCIFFGCNNHELNYPEGGYAYPEKILPADSNLYQYQQMKIPGGADKFFLYTQHLFYEAFDEPNLSIGPLHKEVFRFSYSAYFFPSIIIDLTEDSVIIKKGNPGSLSGIYISKLSQEEKFHLLFLNRHFPIDTTDKKQPHFKSIDSLVKLYPELLDDSYYYKLITKTYPATQAEFKYELTRFAITRGQFIKVINDINQSGYWKLPSLIPCDNPPLDGYGYRLEANTRRWFKSVTAGSCTGDTTNFKKICQEIVELAKMGDEIHLVRKKK